MVASILIIGGKSSKEVILNFKIIFVFVYLLTQLSVFQVFQDSIKCGHHFKLHNNVFVYLLKQLDLKQVEYFKIQ